jgi:hypothetical protein
MNFWSRTTAPGVFLPAARDFDELVVNTFTKRMNLPTLADGPISSISAR